MEPVKDEILGVVRRRAEEEARYLAGEFLRTALEDREAIMAALEQEQWLCESCDSCF